MADNQRFTRNRVRIFTHTIFYNLLNINDFAATAQRFSDQRFIDLRFIHIHCGISR